MELLLYSLIGFCALILLALVAVIFACIHFGSLKFGFTFELTARNTGDMRVAPAEKPL